VPELPEVEIARRNLQRWTQDRTVTGVEALDPARSPVAPGALEGRRVLAWERRGKLLIGRLEGVTLFSHLGMTGKWVRDPAGRRFLRLRVALSGGLEVGVLDARRLGRTWLVPGRGDDDPAVARLGPDPLADGVHGTGGLGGLDGELLRARLAGGRGAVKTLLLDQGRIAGLGNICAVEACFRAGLHPHTPAAELGAEDLERLARGLREHIARTLEIEDGDEIAYVTQGGHNPFLVYGREGAPCPRCAAAIARETLAGRPTFTCPRCQPPRSP